MAITSDIKCPKCGHWQIPIHYCPLCGYDWEAARQETWKQIKEDWEKEQNWQDEGGK